MGYSTDTKCKGLLFTNTVLLNVGKQNIIVREWKTSVLFTNENVRLMSRVNSSARMGRAPSAPPPIEGCPQVERGAVESDMRVYFIAPQSAAKVKNKNHLLFRT